MATRLAVFDSHPIQYSVPIWRHLAAEPGLEPVVHYLGERGVRETLDREFGVPVRWDVPLLEGYPHRFLRRDADVERPTSLTLPDLEGFLDREPPDAVLVPGYAYPFCLQVVRAARRRGLVTLVRGEFTDADPYPRRGPLRALARELYLRLFYQQVDAFCYVGTEARRHLERRGIGAERLFFSPHAVDDRALESQRDPLDRAACRARLGIPPDRLVLLFSGKLIPRKAPLLVLEALARLPRREPVALVVLGDGELRPRFEAEGRRLLGKDLHMVGFVNQSALGLHYRAADVAVLPSRFETWGLVVNEAMHFGLPVIASRAVGCAPDLIVEGRTGFTFVPGDAADLAGRIAALARDRARARSMGEAARDHVRGFTSARAARGIVDALTATLRRRPGDGSAPVAPR